MNKVILIGRIGKDAETKTFDNGNSVINFSLATSEKYKDKDGEWLEQTEWHNVSMFQKSVKIAEYLLKGTQIAVEGQVKTRSWDDRDGNKRYTTEIVVTPYKGNVEILSRVESTQPQQAPTSANNATDGNNEQGDSDDLPF